MMRVAVLTNLFPPDAIGGYEMLGADVVAKLRLRGHTVEVWTTGTRRAHDPSVHRVLELERGFERPSFGPSERVQALWRRAVVTRTNRSRALRDWRVFRPEVVLVLSQLRLGLGGSHAAADLGVPTVFSFNDAHLLGFAPSTGRRARYDSGLGRATTWRGL
ncbi:MAG: glycosyltransferase, partial [Polyangiales bacterium]